MEQHNFDDLTFKIPDGLSRSVNLGCIDINPKASGKKHWYFFYYIFDNSFKITNLYCNLPCLVHHFQFWLTQ